VDEVLCIEQRLLWELDGDSWRPWARHGDEARSERPAAKASKKDVEVAGVVPYGCALLKS
jgi:hypothetical protein